MLKRFVTVLTVVALLCSVFSLGFVSGAVYINDVIYGDINGDGVVSTEDARLALQAAGNLYAIEDEAQLKRADINGDGAVSIYDARQILRCAAGIANLQPSGAFAGFEDNGIFYGDEETLVANFNAYLNSAKVTTEDSQYFAATITKTENDELVEFNIEEVEIPAFSFGTSAEGIADMVEAELTADDKKDSVTVIPYSETDFSLMHIEESAYVSRLTAADVFGARADFDQELGELTIEIAIPDTEIEAAAGSSYSGVFKSSDLIAAHDSTLLKLMGSGSDEVAMLREFKNCVLKAVIDTATNKVMKYTISYESKVYVAQTDFGISALTAATLKGIEYHKTHTIEYDFQWPVPITE